MIYKLYFMVLLVLFSSFTSTINRSTTPTEIYGSQSAKIALTIGNGGAGPTCLLQALSEDFIKFENLDIRIAWIQGISRLTLENLKKKVIDVSLTYESEPELQALKEGYASERTLVFNDHFLIVGPKNNPSHLVPTDKPEEAFKKIADSAAFFSRNDGSGTNERELGIWKMLDLTPNVDQPKWYVTKTVFPVDALIKADKENLYTLTDRGTLLAASKDLKNTSVYIQESNELLNRCHAMLQDNPSHYAKLFLNYLKSERGQNLIEHYAGKNQTKESCPLFTSAKKDQFLEAGCLKRLGL